MKKYAVVIWQTFPNRMFGAGRARQSAALSA